MERYNRVIAYARARDSEKNQNSILDFVYNKLTGTLGPCGNSEPNEINGKTRFFFDTFCGLSISIIPLIYGVTDNDKDLLLNNLSGKEIKMANYLFSLDSAFFKVEDEKKGSYFKEDYLLFLRDFISYCGGGVIKWIYLNEDDEQENMKFEIINGYKHSEDEIKNAINTTNTLIKVNKNNNIFSDDELEKANNIGFDNIPYGYFIGLSNGFLEDRCIITKDSDLVIYKKLQYISSLINKKYIKSYPRVFDRVNKMNERLNSISFIQYIIQIKDVNVYVDNIDNIDELVYLYEEYIESYKEWLKNLKYDVNKNTKGIDKILSV